MCCKKTQLTKVNLNITVTIMADNQHIISNSYNLIKIVLAVKYKFFQSKT